MRGSLLAAALGMSAWGGFHPLSGQQSPSLARWQRVRVTAPAAGLVRNVFGLESVTADSVILVRQPSPGQLDTVRLPRNALQRFEVSRHRGSLALPGFGIGLGVGAVVAAQWAKKTPNPSGNSFGPQVDNVGGILLRVIAGGLAGAIVGGSIHTEHWATVPVGELRMSLTTWPAGHLELGAALTL